VQQCRRMQQVLVWVLDCECINAGMEGCHTTQPHTTQAALGIWGTSEAAAPRLQAFLVCRQLALTMASLPQQQQEQQRGASGAVTFMEKVLRGAYKAFLANSKFVSAASAPHIAFMTTCAVELWGLDMQVEARSCDGDNPTSELITLPVN
jgi:hypothetical protein